MPVALQVHLWSFDALTGVQGPDTNALQHWFWQNALHTNQCCSAKQAHSMHVSLQLHLWRFAAHTSVQ